MGFRATIAGRTTRIFDPSWFAGKDVDYRANNFSDPGGDVIGLTDASVYTSNQDEVVESILRGDMHLLSVHP